VYPEDLAADVTLHFDSGERYRFGEVRESALPDISVTGVVHVPRAAITLEELPAQAVRPRGERLGRSELDGNV